MAGTLTSGSIAQARAKREFAAMKYKPKKVRMLLVAEAPPSALDRYFYFEDVASHDWLFFGVVEGLFGHKPDRSAKAKWLTKLQESGVFLIDLKLDPLDSPREPLDACVPDLVARARLLHPECIVLIKASVYDAAYESLTDSGLPVIDKRIPFPSTGQQGKFREEFKAAISLCHGNHT